MAPSTGQTYDIARKGLAGTAGGEYRVETVPGGTVTCTAKDAARLGGVVGSGPCL